MLYHRRVAVVVRQKAEYKICSFFLNDVHMAFVADVSRKGWIGTFISDLLRCLMCQNTVNVGGCEVHYTV